MNYKLIKCVGEMPKLPHASKAKSELLKRRIILKNIGKVYRQYTMDGSYRLASNLSYKQLDLPKNCEAYLYIEDPYSDIAILLIAKDGEEITNLATAVNMAYSNKESESIIRSLTKMNDGHIFVRKIKKNYIIDSDLYLDEIKLPDGLKTTIVYYPSEVDNAVQCRIESVDNKYLPAVLNCKYKRVKKNSK